MKIIKTVCLLVLFTLLLVPFQNKVLAIQGEATPVASSKAGIILRKNKNIKPTEPSSSQSGNGTDNSTIHPPSKANGKNNYPQTGEGRETSFIFTLLGGVLLIAGILLLIRKKKKKEEDK